MVHALKVREAVRTDNYHQFFLLYRNAPNMGIYLMDRMIEAMRITALQRIKSAFRPNIDVDYVLRELCLEKGTRVETTHMSGLAYLRRVGCIITDAENNPLPESADKSPTITGKFINLKESNISKPPPLAATKKQTH